MKQHGEKNIALSAFGYDPKRNKKQRWTMLFKKVSKVLLVLNLSFLGVSGCTDTDLDSAILKATINAIIEIGIAQDWNSHQIKYFVASQSNRLNQSVTLDNRAQRRFLG